MNNNMDTKIENIIQGLKKSNHLTHALDCINFIVNKESSKMIPKFRNYCVTNLSDY